MLFDIDPLYMIYLFVALATGLFVEGIYLLVVPSRSYRKNINRRLNLMDAQPDREAILVQIRRERGLSTTGDYRLPLVALNRLILQSGLTTGIGKFATYTGIFALIVVAALMVVRGDLLEELGAGLFCCTLLPLLVLKFKRGRRQKRFGAQFPDALDIIVRSLRAGHPVPIAISMVAREMPDPIGSEFGTVADEITYGADLETGMRNLYFRVGQEDLPLFVTAIAIQSSTGGNLGEILENLSAVIRQRFKMRRKIRALASEGRASAMILSSLPILMFLVLQVISPDFYASVWHESVTKIALACAGGWMGIGNLIMFRMVNFKIDPGTCHMGAIDLFFAESNSTMMAVLVFLAAGTLAFSLMAVIRVQGSVKRRAANIGRDIGPPGGARSLRYSSLKAAQRVIDYTTKHYATGDTKETKVLRRRMIQAGIYDPHAVAYFFLGRTILAVGLAALAFFFLPMEPGTTQYWLCIGLAGIAGYLGPSFYIDMRIKKRKAEHQTGFPDFMDLLVVCADAGLSMEASLDRVGRELGDSYPSLTANIHMACLEIRAGRTMSEALEHLGDRLGIEEARSFSTLIQQSEELGSSITDALRVYSDDMRHKRLSRAEEKAYSLPAKLSVPMMVCIFPVLFVVILLPVFVRLYLGNY